jgi:hypothetical protein
MTIASNKMQVGCIAQTHGTVRLKLTFPPGLCERLRPSEPNVAPHSCLRLVFCSVTKTKTKSFVNMVVLWRTEH